MNNPQVSQYGHKNNKFDMKNHYYLFLLFSISIFTHAQELDFIQYSDISSIPQIVTHAVKSVEPNLGDFNYAA